MKPLIVANWKMNPESLKGAFDLASSVVKGANGLDVDVVLCPPFVYIPQLLPSANVFIGAQNCFWEEEGAFTGEVSPRMLKNMGCSYVILGHSERKNNVGETLGMVNKKVLMALREQLVPLLCIGENVEKELPEVLKNVAKEDLNHLVLVYEPEWAVSTEKNSKPDTPEHIKKTIEKIKKIAGTNVRVLYGGSVQSSNIQDFLKEGGAQGVLVGAASLNSNEFIKLIYGAIL